MEAIKIIYIYGLNIFFGIITKAYKKLEDRVGFIKNTKGSKSDRIEKTIEDKLDYFTKKTLGLRFI